MSVSGIKLGTNSAYFLADSKNAVSTINSYMGVGGGRDSSRPKFE